MTKQETIQVLQSIEDRAKDFTNMTECDWVAIAAAKRHLTEEPTSDNLIEALTTCSDKARLNKESPFFSENDYEQGFKDCYQWQKIPSKDLDELISNLSKRYPEVSFAKLTRIAVQVSRWQKQKDDEALDFNALLYVARQEGVEQGKAEMKQDMINKACEWLRKELVNFEDLIKDFGKAIEE